MQHNADIAPDPLPSWRPGWTKWAVLNFVHTASSPLDPAFVPLEERVAVFDNDGTLWCEKPLPVQADFLLQRIGVMAEEDPSLTQRQPWKAVASKDYGWLGGAITKHYGGDDNDLKEMAAGLLQAYAGSTIDEYQDAARRFVETSTNPAAGRRYLDSAYQPMVELLHYLDDHGFACYVASGGSRDFMRPITEGMYGIPPERVIGSTVALAYDAARGTIVHRQALDFFDDGPEKVVRIWSRIGRRPVIAAGNSNGDIEMLQFAGGDRPALRLLIRHDDDEREFDYVQGAERALSQIDDHHVTVVSMKHDWDTVFADASRP